MKKMLVTGLAMFLSTVTMASTLTEKGLHLVREVVSTNPGLEFIVNYRAFNATKTTLSLRFDVFPAGKTTKLFSTTTKSVTLPAMACSGEIGFELNDGELAAKETGGPNQLMYVTVYRYCTNSEEENVVTYLYGADISAAGKTPWIKSISNFYVFDVDMINTDADTALELFLWGDSAGTSKGRLVILNPLTGAAEATSVDYSYANSTYLVD